MPCSSSLFSSLKKDGELKYSDEKQGVLYLRLKDQLNPLSWNDCIIANEFILEDKDPNEGIIDDGVVENGFAMALI